jgi:carbamoyltransferase
MSEWKLSLQTRRKQVPPRAVLGLSALAHSPAAALIIDGRLVGAVEEERLNRDKDTYRFPHLAIDWLLSQAGMEFAALDAIGFYWDDWGMFPRAFLHNTKQLCCRESNTRLTAQRLASILGPLLLSRQLASRTSASARALPAIVHVPHHRAHLCAGKFSSPFLPHAGMVIDGRGEYAATSTFRFDAKLGRYAARIDEEVAFPNSLGVYYGAITQMLGYSPISDEYKVMGLAAYGERESCWLARMSEFLVVRPNGKYRINSAFLDSGSCSRSESSWLNPKGVRYLGGVFRDEAGFTQQAKNFAWAAQHQLEHAIIELVRRLVRRTGASNLILAGGVAMNASAVGALRRSGVVSELHLPLAPYDAGASIGAALAVLEQFGGKIPPASALVDPFLGPSYSDYEIEAALRDSGWRFTKCDPAVEAAREVAEGKTVGWFQGRLEFGARALGARSILGDPRVTATRERINRSVKRRERYRPFAPSVLEECANDYFEMQSSRLMGEVVKVRPLAKQTVPAIVHVDDTARPQTVPAEFPQPQFRRMIEQFRAITGVPMVVNTSFNVRGEPIVCSANDAVRCFAGCGLDTLIIGSFVARKERSDFSP